MGSKDSLRQIIFRFCTCNNTTLQSWELNNQTLNLKPRLGFFALSCSPEYPFILRLFRALEDGLPR